MSSTLPSVSETTCSSDLSTPHIITSVSPLIVANHNPEIGSFRPVNIVSPCSLSIKVPSGFWIACIFSHDFTHLK